VTAETNKIAYLLISMLFKRADRYERMKDFWWFSGRKHVVRLISQFPPAGSSYLFFVPLLSLLLALQTYIRVHFNSINDVGVAADAAQCPRQVYALWCLKSEEPKSWRITHPHNRRCMCSSASRFLFCILQRTASARENTKKESGWPGIRLKAANLQYL